MHGKLLFATLHKAWRSPTVVSVFARKGELLLTSTEDGISPQTVLQGVHTTPGLGGVVLTHFDMSETGTLVYAPAGEAKPDDQLVWVDRGGNETLITSGSGTWVHPRQSPDRTRVSIDIHAPNGMRDLYAYDLSRGQLNRLTNNGTTWETAWRPDGERIAIMSGAPAGQWSLFLVPSDLGGEPELLFRSNHAVPVEWTDDGATLFFHELVDGGIWKITAGRGRDSGDCDKYTGE